MLRDDKRRDCIFVYPSSPRLALSQRRSVGEQSQRGVGGVRFSPRVRRARAMGGKPLIAHLRRPSATGRLPRSSAVFYNIIVLRYDLD